MKVRNLRTLAVVAAATASLAPLEAHNLDTTAIGNGSIGLHRSGGHRRFRYRGLFHDDLRQLGQPTDQHQPARRGIRIHHGRQRRLRILAPLPAMIGDQVFADYNFNGVYDAGDLTLGNVSVQLYDSMFPYWPGPSLLTNASVSDTVRDSPPSTMRWGTLR